MAGGVAVDGADGGAGALPVDGVDLRPVGLEEEVVDLVQRVVKRRLAATSE